jgi:ABC-type lipoprotein export system ATPase subunit
MVTHETNIAKRAKKHIYIKDGQLVKKYLWKPKAIFTICWLLL